MIYISTDLFIAAGGFVLLNLVVWTCIWHERWSSHRRYMRATNQTLQLIKEEV